MICVEPIGYVRAERTGTTDDFWGGTESRIVLVNSMPVDALLGMEEFSHAEVLFHFDRVDPAQLVRGSRHPRDNPAWPKVGILAQRAKCRPNLLGSTIVRVLGREGRVLRVAELDALDGTPVIDIKPVMAGFLPRQPVHQPVWSRELMSTYWARRGDAPSTKVTRAGTGMRVYQIKFRSSIFQRFSPVAEGLYQTGTLRFDGKRKAASWQPLEVYVLHPALEVPDIWQLSASGSTLIVAPDVAEKLAWPLRTAGELLPVRHEGKDFLLCNVTEVVNCLDRGRTEFRRIGLQGFGIGPVKYAFHPNRFTTPLFKIPEEATAALFALERSGDPDKELKAAVEKHGLKGIEFELLWEAPKNA